MDEVDDGMSMRGMLEGKETENEELEKEKWKKQIFNHKESVLLSYPFLHCIEYQFRLADTIHNLFETSLPPFVPAFLHNILTKCNIIIRL